MIALAAVATVAVLTLGFTCRELLRRLEMERERHRVEVAELWNRIQHPRIYQPTPEQERTIRETAGDPSEPDEFEIAGTVQPSPPPAGDRDAEFLVTAGPPR